MADVAQTVSRMREFYREREPQLALVPVDLNGLVKQVVDLTRVRWSDMQLRDGAVIDLKTDYAATLPAVLGIESELREALTNLVFNAVDAMPEGGTLTLRTRAVDSQIELAVRDTGAGIAAEDLPFIFDRFYRADKARQRAGSNESGLGLAITKAIVEAHGGKIWAESEPGKGSTFCFTVPAAR